MPENPETSTEATPETTRAVETTAATAATAGAEQPVVEIDYTKIGQAVQQSIRESMQPPPQPATKEPPDALAQVLAPYLAPIVQQTTLQQELLNDAVDFYAKHPDAAEDREEIESRTHSLAKQGRPMRREDVYAWMKGKFADKYEKRQSERRKRELEQASLGVTAGGSLGRPATGAGKRPHEMTDDELAKALDGVTF
jgi:hypothetical protein